MLITKFIILGAKTRYSSVLVEKTTQVKELMFKSNRKLCEISSRFFVLFTLNKAGKIDKQTATYSIVPIYARISILLLSISNSIYYLLSVSPYFAGKLIYR